MLKQFKIRSSDILQILVYFQNFDAYFINRYFAVWGLTIVFPQVPLFHKLLDFSIHLLNPVQGQFVTIKTSQDEFSFGKLDFTPKQLMSHIFFSCKVHIPLSAPFPPNSTANRMAGKSRNRRGQCWTLNHMALKLWISHPSVGWNTFSIHEVLICMIYMALIYIMCCYT